MKIFNYDIHLGKFRVLVQSRDLNNQAVTTEKMADGSVTPRKLHPDVELAWLKPILDQRCKCIERQIAEIRQLVTSYTKNGIALSGQFGGGDDIGITQKKLTEEMNRVWDKLSDITGEPVDGISVTVTPDQFVTDVAVVDVAVTASYHPIDLLQIFVDGGLAVEARGVEYLDRQIQLTKTSVIRTEAHILGNFYSDTKIVEQTGRPFHIGGGTNWEDVMTMEYAHANNGGIAGTYTFEVHNEGDRIIVVFPTAITGSATHMMMNDLVIPMAIDHVGNDTVWMSANTYQAGTYTIKIE